MTLSDVLAEHRLVAFDADTGEMITPSLPLPHETWLKIGAQCFPGCPPEILDAAYSAWLESDATPPVTFDLGSKVRHAELPERLSRLGTVVRRVEQDGELHTVLVRWEGLPGETPYGPRELVEVTE